mmetsp:Transcript_9826/g.12763  ORF Transcript_9826/g.12763 Transcript_9826/m.12763 type:complete len:438 (-) Transcript_9826:1452-2765(-)
MQRRRLTASVITALAFPVNVFTFVPPTTPGKSKISRNYYSNTVDDTLLYRGVRSQRNIGTSILSMYRDVKSEIVDDSWRLKFSSVSKRESKGLIQLRASVNTGAVTEDESNDVVDEGWSGKDQLLVVSFLLILFASFAILLTLLPTGGWRYFLAGGVCASTSHAIATPIDVIKTRKQVDAEYKYEGLMKSALRLVKNEGVVILLAGFGPTVFGYLFEGALKFGLYEVLKPVASRFASYCAFLLKMELKSRIPAYLLCGVVSGYAASLLLCPMEALRIRLVSEPEVGKEGWVQGGMKMVHNEGIRGFFKGMTAMLSKQIPYTVTKQVSFDLITAMIYTNISSLSNSTFVVPFISALMSSILSCISSHPGDMLLSVVNAHEGKRRTREFAKKIYKEDGILGFFTGIAPRFLHVGIIVTSQLLIYDWIKRLFGCGATGLV